MKSAVPQSLRGLPFCLGLAFLLFTGCNSSSTTTAAKPLSSPPPTTPAKPALPITITFVLDKDTTGLRAHYTNNSTEPLEVIATWHNPTLDGDQHFNLVLAPGKTLTGDKLFHAGETVTVENADYAPMTKKAE